MRKIIRWLRGSARRIYRLSPLVLLFLLLSYCFSDFVTSPQTYHLNSDRTVSKVLLVASAVFAFFLAFVSFFVSKEPERKKRIIPFFLLGSVLSMIPVFSDVLNNKFGANTLALAVYPAFFVSLFAFFYLYPVTLLRKRAITHGFYLTVFFVFAMLLFYFFKVRATPTSGLNFRSPILSHVYLLVGLVPLSYYLFSFKGFLCYSAFVTATVFLSDKGTPLVSLGFIFGFIVFRYLFIHRRHLFWTALAFSFCAVVGVVAADFLFLGRALWNKIVNESVSIRIDGYISILKNLRTFTLPQLIFGKGTAAVTIIHEGLAAHNDFLEYLYDYGLVGLLVFVSFLVATFRVIAPRGTRESPRWFFVLISIAVIFPITLFSALFTNTNLFLFVSVGLGAARPQKANVVLTAKRLEYDRIFI